MAEKEPKVNISPKNSPSSTENDMGKDSPDSASEQQNSQCFNYPQPVLQTRTAAEYTQAVRLWLWQWQWWNQMNMFNLTLMLHTWNMMSVQGVTGTTQSCGSGSTSRTSPAAPPHAPPHPAQWQHQARPAASQQQNARQPQAATRIGKN